MVHGRNATTLAREHPLAGDPHVTFDEEEHKYTVHGQEVQCSCTRAVHSKFEEFDSALTVNTYYASWKRNKSKPLHSFIWEVLESDTRADDDDAKRAIMSHWHALGVKASALGTALHLYIEKYYNDVMIAPIPQEIAHEVTLFHRFVASPFYKDNCLKMVRTELSVFYTKAAVGSGGPPVAVCAGQIDALMQDKCGSYYIVDWKRSKHVLTPRTRAFNNKKGIHPITQSIPDTDFCKYSLQLSLYSVMLEHAHSLKAADRLFLVRMAPDLDTAEVTQCFDYRTEARAILEAL